MSAAAACQNVMAVCLPHHSLPCGNWPHVQCCPHIPAVSLWYRGQTDKPPSNNSTIACTIFQTHLHTHPTTPAGHTNHVNTVNQNPGINNPRHSQPHPDPHSYRQYNLTHIGNTTGATILVTAPCALLLGAAAAVELSLGCTLCCSGGLDLVELLPHHLHSTPKHTRMYHLRGRQGLMGIL